MGRYYNVYLAIVFNILGQLSLKWSMLHFKDFTLRPLQLSRILSLVLAPYSVLGLILYAISAVFWMIALTKVELSVAYPMLSIGYVLIFFVSIFLFDEPFKYIRLLGVILIVIGVYFISR